MRPLSSTRRLNANPTEPTHLRHAVSFRHLTANTGGTLPRGLPQDTLATRPEREYTMGTLLLLGLLLFVPSMVGAAGAEDALARGHTGGTE